MSCLSGIKRSSLSAAIGASVVGAIYVGWLFARNLTPDEHLLTLYRFVIAALLATWLVADTREAGRSQPTFDYGAYFVFALVLFAPYYLIATRRWRGLLMLAGMALLFLLPALAILAVAAYVS
jgi:uncharacterized membrane protein YhaH (DUF805 family)